MISFADQPFVVTLEDAESGDGLDILLLGVSGPDTSRGLILASGVLEWYPLDKIKVVTSLVAYEPVDEPAETP